MRHPGVRLLVVTGGGAVVRAAMATGKRAICAGPGNPPVVVDETADIDKAARDIVLGASTDNNIICTDEKEVICVASVADDLLKAIAKSDAVVLGPHQLSALEKLVFSEMGGARKDGPDQQGPDRQERRRHSRQARDERARLGAPRGRRGGRRPPVALDRADDADPAGLPGAQRRHARSTSRSEVEGGNRHTAVMHSKQLDNLSRMAKACDCSIFVKNGRSQAGLGLDGEGYCSFTIASPTGEGMTSPRSFSRWRRCVLVDHFRIT